MLDCNSVKISKILPLSRVQKKVIVNFWETLKKYES